MKQTTAQEFKNAVILEMMRRHKKASNAFEKEIKFGDKKNASYLLAEKEFNRMSDFVDELVSIFETIRG